jgi:hypothetical protein
VGDDQFSYSGAEFGAEAVGAGLMLFDRLPEVDQIIKAGNARPSTGTGAQHERHARRVEETRILQLGNALQKGGVSEHHGGKCVRVRRDVLAILQDEPYEIIGLRDVGRVRTHLEQHLQLIQRRVDLLAVGTGDVGHHQ